MRALAALLCALLLTAPALAQTDPNRLPPHLDPQRTANGLALTPPMGWNSWNKFA
jgi:alpha-galactosidase